VVFSEPSFPKLADELWSAITENAYGRFATTLRAATQAGVLRLADPEATAAVLVASLAYYPMVSLLIGHTPGEINRERYLEAWVSHARALVRQAVLAPGETPSGQRYYPLRFGPAHNRIGHRRHSQKQPRRSLAGGDEHLLSLGFGFCGHLARQLGDAPLVPAIDGSRAGHDPPPVVDDCTDDQQQTEQCPHLPTIAFIDAEGGQVSRERVQPVDRLSVFQRSWAGPGVCGSEPTASGSRAGGGRSPTVRRPQ
jgi:AefR-like transcriptional repressor, C-terminal domain